MNDLDTRQTDIISYFTLCSFLTFTLPFNHSKKHNQTFRFSKRERGSIFPRSSELRPNGHNSCLALDPGEHRSLRRGLAECHPSGSWHRSRLCALLDRVECGARGNSLQSRHSDVWLGAVALVAGRRSSPLCCHRVPSRKLFRRSVSHAAHEVLAREAVSSAAVHAIHSSGVWKCLWAQCGWSSYR